MREESVTSSDKYANELAQLNQEMLELMSLVKKKKITTQQYRERSLENESRRIAIEKKRLDEQLNDLDAQIDNTTDGSNQSLPANVESPINNTNADTGQKNGELATCEAQEPKHVYGGKWVVMQNRLLYAITPLDFHERRLIMLLSPIVRREVDKDPNQHVFSVSVNEYKQEYGVKGNSIYAELAKIADSIMEKAFFFWYENEGRKAKKGVSWVSECDYIENEGRLDFKLDDTVIEMLTVFDKENPYTKYMRQQIINLGIYGLILYEMITGLMYQSNKKKTFSITYLREKFDCTNKYITKTGKGSTDFIRYVIDKAIKEIAKHTSYRISYEKVKDGKEVTGLTFSFFDNRVVAEVEQKTSSQKSITDAVSIANKNKSWRTSWKKKGLSDKQINVLKIYAEEFVNANTAKVRKNEDRNSYTQIIDNWTPALKDPKRVTHFEMVQELLDRTVPKKQ